MKVFIVLAGAIIVFVLVCSGLIMKWKQDDENYYEDEIIAAKIARCVAPICVILFSIFFGSIYFIGEQENAVIETFGVPSLVEESGIHFKIPLLQSVEKVDTTIQGMAIGYNEENNESLQDECLMITNDYNFVNVDFFVEYMISSPVDYLYSVDKPDEIFKNIVQSSIRSVVSNYSVDGVLTTEKGQIQTDVRDMVSLSLEQCNIGISVVNVTIQDADPPTQEVIDAFKSVETAKQQKETKINEAKKYASEKLPANEADVDKILQDAQTTKEQRINEARQQVALFNAMYEEYSKDKETTKRRMFFETMQEVIPQLKVIVDGSEMSLNALYPIESLNTENGGTK